MRQPTWLKSIIATTLLASAAWAIQDRIGLGERLASVEAYIRESIRRFDKIDQSNDRIERKLDRLDRSIKERE